MKNNMTTYVENICINILCISSNLKSRCACLTQLQVKPRLVFRLPRPVAMSDLPGAGLELFVRREKNVERIWIRRRRRRPSPWPWPSPSPSFSLLFSLRMTDRYYPHVWLDMAWYWGPLRRVRYVVGAARAGGLIMYTLECKTNSWRVKLK